MNIYNQTKLRKSWLWTNEEDQILISEYNGKTEIINKLLNKINKSRSQIIRRAIKLGLNKRNFWKDEYDIFLINNYKVKGCRYCSNYLGFNYDYICSKACKLGLKLTVEEKSDLTTKFDASIFENPEQPEICYLLGLIYADGYIDKPHCSYSYKRIHFSIVEDDFNDIENVIIKSGNWHISKRFPKNRKPIKQAICCNRRLWNFLIDNDYHIKSGTSADKILSKIPEHLKHYWWRGYFDGDGWFNFKVKLKYSFGFSACLTQNWSFVIDLLNRLKVNFCVSKRKTKHGNSSQITCNNFYGTEVFANYIYKNYLNDKIGLARKFTKFQDMKKAKNS